MDSHNATDPYIQFPGEILKDMTPEQAQMIVERFGAHTLMQLPAADIAFFEWLKTAERSVWDDLWTDENNDQPYLIGISFLPLFLDSSRGFPICDLLKNDNYFFSAAHMPDDEAGIFVEAVKERYMEGHALTVQQLLALEISIAPIDIWRFAYHHQIPLERAKQAVQQLVDDEILIHLKEADQLNTFLDF
jgi:hypothetical protein